MKVDIGATSEHAIDKVREQHNWLHVMQMAVERPELCKSIMTTWFPLLSHGDARACASKCVEIIQEEVEK